MIFWDGNDLDMFIKIVETVLLRRPVRVKMKDGAVKNVASFEDVRALLPPRNRHTELSEREYEEVLDTFLPSGEMRDHLLKNKLTKNEIMELIFGAPVPLRVKAEYCRRLTRRDDMFHDILDEAIADPKNSGSAADTPEIKARFLRGHVEDYSFTRHFQAISAALDELELRPGELFCLNEAWLDSETMEEGMPGGSVPFFSFDAALRYVRNEMEEEEWADDTLCWTKLEKWIHVENGEMRRTYTYYLIRDEVVFFDLPKPAIRDHLDRILFDRLRYSLSRVHLNLSVLSVPYRPGDIVEIDCLPFVPVSRVVLLEVGNGCCGVTCLYRTKNGFWETGALKHGHFTDAVTFSFCISPLYRIAAFTGTLPPGEMLLAAVQDYIAGDAKKGRRLWYDIFQLTSPPREEDIRRLIGD